MDAFSQDVPQRIEPTRVQVIGREEAGHQVHGDEGGGVIEGPAAEQEVERAPPQGTVPGRIRNLAPEDLKRSLRPLGPAFGVAIGQHRGVHRAGRGAGDGLDPQPWLLQQPVEHAPGEGPMCSAPLQREVHQHGILLRITSGAIVRHGCPRGVSTRPSISGTADRAARMRCESGCAIGSLRSLVDPGLPLPLVERQYRLRIALWPLQRQ